MNTVLHDVPSYRSTLIDILRWRAMAEPEKLAYTFLLDGQVREAQLTYAELDVEARRIAALLQMHTLPGDRVLLVYQPGLEYIAAVFGCFYAGVIAIPAYPPRLNHNLTRIAAILQDAQVTFAITTSSLLATLRRTFTADPLLQHLVWLETDKVPEGITESWREWHGKQEDVALFQYTSGSTGNPKGVMLTHGHLMHNARLIQESMGLHAEMRVGSWLPPYHDMGLMGGILEPVYVGTRSILMAPAAFLQHPLRWLHMISRYKVHGSGAPNFAYDLCVRKATPEQLVNLDLSQWQVAFSGAEPVRAETLERFAATFAASGFRKEAFYPCYGLAEATVFVSGGHQWALPHVHHFESTALEAGRIVEKEIGQEQTRSLVGCGFARPEQRLVIADPQECTPCAPDEVGEIWVSSPNVAQGYWGKAEETSQTFQAFLKESGEGPFLRTGDLGFMQNGELFVTGRLKDLIIIRGRNLYPHDIELEVEKSHPALRQSAGAAFAVPGKETEDLVIVQEVQRHYDTWNVADIIRSIGQAVVAAFEVEVAAIVLLHAGTIYKTTSGKVQRQACRQSFLNGELEQSAVSSWYREREDTQERKALDTKSKEAPSFVDGAQTESFAPKRKTDEIVTWLVTRIAEHAQLDPGTIDVHASFTQYGLSSLQAVDLSSELEQWLKRSLSPTLIYDYPSIVALAKHLSTSELVLEPRESTNEPIAIVGMGCCFPGATNLEEFWHLLATGTDAIQEVPLDHWHPDTHLTSREEVPNIYQGGFIERAHLFDASFFGLSPHEAKYMDPQQRLLLEVTWEALEHAGQVPCELAGTATGVFIGISNNDYGRLLFRDEMVDPLISTGNSYSIAANRLSYLLDLKGPSVAIDTACSSSLVAVHMACQSLRSGEATLALAGGVNLILSPEVSLALTQAQMLAADSRCKTFDSRADGYVRSEGCGVVVLERISDARKAGHRILAVIRGSAMNQNGRSNGLVAPNGLAQQELIRQALRVAHVSSRQISYVEAHGTGTSLGDPIEVQALSAVFAEEQDREEPCLLGSAKTNVGHLEAASAMTGLIKVVLSLQKQQIPPHLHLETINPHISLQETCFRIPTTLVPWPVGKEPRRAGVSSFGFGGTNAHIILEEGPLQASIEQDSQQPQLLVLSARTSTALERATNQLADYLNHHPETPLADVATTLQTGRTHFHYRSYLVSRSSNEALETLRMSSSGSIVSGQQTASPPNVAFLFPGIGSQHVGMAHELYLHEPVFRASVDRSVALLESHLGFDLRTVLYPVSGQEAFAQTQIIRPAIGYLVLFVISYAMAQLWITRGVKPAAMLGHSMGEYVAACLAGVFSLEDALAAVAVRGRFFETLPAGAMLSVALSEEQVRPLLGTQLSLAAINSPSLSVVAGPVEAIEQLTAKLAEQHVATWPIHITMAAHSMMVEPMLPEFLQYLQTLKFHAPTIPYISNVTGTWITEEQATDPQYWIKHTRQTVRFVEGLQTLVQSQHPMLIEVGPGQTLSSLVKRGQEQGEAPLVMPSLPRAREQRSAYELGLQTIGRLWLSGVEIKWSSLSANIDERPLPVALPTYPFEHQLYPLLFRGMRSQTSTRKGRQTDLSNWFYVPVWKRQEVSAATRVQEQTQQISRWLVFLDYSDVGSLLVQQLEEDGHDVVTVRPANHFGQQSERAYTLNPRERADYVALLQELHAQNIFPQKIAHLWAIIPSVDTSVFERFDQAQDLGFFSLLFLTQALGERQQDEVLDLIVATDSSQVVTGDEETLSPERATLVGLCRAIPYAYASLTCRCIDIVMPTSRLQLARLGAHLRRELFTETTEALIAYRGAFRWVQTVEAMVLPPQPTQDLPLRKKGVYLITGGLGGIGLELGKSLAQMVQAKLVLLGRTALPARDQWEERATEQDSVARTLRTLLALEALGSEVMVAQADVTDLGRMRIVFNEIEERFGALHGVIHAAGVSGGSTLDIRTITSSDARNVLAPKVHGVLVLQSLIAERELDFLVLCSSLSSFLNATNSVAYSAANVFLDVFAQSVAASTYTAQLTLSINWDMWSEVGMVVHALTHETAETDITRAQLQQLLQNKIASRDGQEAFLRLLGSRCSQVIVTPQSFEEQATLSSHLKQASSQLDKQGSQAPTNFIPRPELRVPYVEPRTHTEQVLTSIWQDVLGFAPLGVDDNIFEVGGDSILSMQIVARAQQAGIQITPQQIFLHQTIAQLAAVVVPSTSSTPSALSPQEKAADHIESLAHLTPMELERVRANHPQIEDLYPLTPLQQGILFHTLREPGSGAYVEQIMCTFRDLDQQRFVEALQYVITQQAILRTAFVWREVEEPLQVVERQVDFSSMSWDWRDRGAEQQRDLDVLLQEDRLRGFDLQQAPVMRVTFIRLDEIRTLVLWSRHQILTDGWSTELLLRDLFACYLALMQERVPSLPSRRPYRDYLAWLQGRAHSEDEIYWRRYLAGIHAPTPLGIDHCTAEGNGEQKAIRYSTEVLKLPVATSSHWQEIARQYQITLNTLVLGAWTLLLSRYSGQQDVLVGTVVSGRPPHLVGVENMIGLFINTLPTRVQVPEEQHAKDWLLNLQTQQMEQRQYEHCALMQVQGWSEVPRDLPLFESVFIFENYPIEIRLHDQSHSLHLETVKIDSQTNYPLTIFVTNEEELSLRVNYDTQRFDRAAIQRLLSHLRMVLEQLTSQPDLSLAAISLLTSQERERLLMGGHISHERHVEGIHTLFERQAEETPDAVAVVYEEQMLTYAELNRRANQLAHYLQIEGVQPEGRVGVLLERSLWHPMVLLGILKAGGAYVPLDSTLPLARLRVMAQDAHTTLLVTSKSLAESVGNIINAVLLLEQIWPQLDVENDANLDALISENNLAYIVYTSGSTGRPKGVLSTHTGVVNYLRFIMRTYHLTSTMTILQIPPISFDASVRDIFATLCVGGRLVLVPERSSKDMRALVTVLQQQQVTALLSVVPSFLRTLLETANSMQQNCRSIHLVLTSGERLPLEVVGQARRIFGVHTQVVNQYGPTEATMTTTYYRVGQTIDQRGFALIGRPIENMQTYVLDQHQSLVPMGITGEVYLAGVGLARGYVEQADATAECFVPNPFSQVSGARMYRTGDLARYRSDGILEYLGRRDQQVKIRGNRVELGEVMATLEDHPDVGQAIVIAQEMEPSTDLQLLAYVIPEQGRVLTAKELRAFLETRLPAYMLPTHFIPLKTIPLTPNGKLDRRALPLPTQQEETEVEEGLTPLQEQIASIWAEMLHQPHVNIHSDFFELGGHSLLAIQLINRIRTTFAVDLPLDSLFETPTVAEMALIIEEIQDEALEQIDDTRLALLLDSIDELS